MTSLAQQLRQLAVPQTQVLLGDDTRRASFLYDAKKAASIDRETFLSIGINGLQELETLDDSFGEFESILFTQPSTESIGVAHSEVFEDGGNLHNDNLRPVLNFYTATLVGVLNTGTVSERIISAILPTLSRGLKSDVVSYKASSYMVLGQMLNKCRLKGSLLETLMNALCKNISPELAREAFCVLLVMFQNQDIDKITRKYPDALDAAVDSVMSSAETDEEREAVKEFLNLSVTSLHHRLAPDSQATLALCLHHRHSTVRANAVKYLLDNLNMMEDVSSVRESLLARLHDDSAAVMKALLKQPEKLRNTDTDGNKMNKLVPLLMDTFCQATSVELARSEAMVLSYLLVSQGDGASAQLAAQVLSSPVVAASKLLSRLAKDPLGEANLSLTP
nr:hypothetical protein BaRGS_010770 [Batillaria attramentaria]